MPDEAVVNVLVGYDGSTAANAAIEGGAFLMPRVRARIAYLWMPPFASETLRRRLWTGTRHVDDTGCPMIVVPRRGSVTAHTPW